MPDNSSSDVRKESLADIYAFVEEQLKLGLGEMAVVGMLEEKGMTRFQANNVVNSVRERIYGVVSKTAGDKNGMGVVSGLIGGIIGAVGGCVAWGAVAAWTRHEISYLALGVGALTAFLVKLFSRGQAGVVGRMIAAICAAAGIIAGKYVAYYYLFKGADYAQYVGEITSKWTLFSSDSLDAFMNNPQDVFSYYDFLWIGLAVYAAFKYAAPNQSK